MRRLTPFPSPGRSLLSHMKLLLLVLPLLAADEHVTVMVQPSTDCRFSVHKGGPEGEELTGDSLHFIRIKILGVDLDSEIYYSIRCAPQKGFCLKVSNCTVSADDGSVEPFTVIDERGCSSDTSIFGHVEVGFWLTRMTFLLFE